jgi:hypothetical protein
MIKKVLKQSLAGLFSGLLTRATRQVSCLTTINYEKNKYIFNLFCFEGIRRGGKLTGEVVITYFEKQISWV